MAQVEGNIDSLSETVFNEARAEAEKVLDSARETAGEVVEEARSQASAEREHILARHFPVVWVRIYFFHQVDLAHFFVGPTE